MSKLSRMMVWSFLFSMTLSSVAHASDFGAGGIGPFSDSGIKGPKYADIVSELDSLGVQYPELATVITYGKSLGGRPLTLIKISKKSVKPGADAKAVLIAGSIHGNEYLNIEDRLPRWFIESGLSRASIQAFLNQGGAVYLAPILNPDGYDGRKRANNNGKDLNRDFTVKRKGHFGFKQVETKSLTETLGDDLQAENRRLVLTLDYHCCIGAILRPWSFKTSTPPAKDMERFDVVGKILKDTFGNRYKYGTTPNILGYEAVGTSKDYYYETYGAVALTFEGKQDQEDKRFPEHTQMWGRIFDEIVAGRI